MPTIFDDVREAGYSQAVWDGRGETDDARDDIGLLNLVDSTTSAATSWLLFHID